MRNKGAITLYAILKGYNINVGKMIEKSILDYCKSNYRGLMPHLAIIIELCNMGEITYLWEEEVNCPKVSPLTLIGITKGPRNKGKAVIEEEEEILRIEQAPREEVNMAAQKINEVPTMPLYMSAMEEVPSHELPYWHLFTGTRSFSPTWGRPQEARNIHPHWHTSSGDTRNFPEQAESLRQG